MMNAIGQRAMQGFDWQAAHRGLGASALALLVGGSVFIGLGLATARLHGAPGVAEPKRVELIVDYGDGVEKRFTQLPWSSEMTVFDAMQLAQNHKRGITFEHRGQGSTVLVTKIDDLANEGGSGRNWIYRVNDQMGQRSVGVQALEAGDTILWKFEKYP